MSTVIRQHIINMIEPMGWICEEGLKWLEEECLPSDTLSIIYHKLLKQAETDEKFRLWLWSFFNELNSGDYAVYGSHGLEEAEVLLWHHNHVNPPETAEEWHEIFESLPVDHRDIEECLILCHMNYEDIQKEEDND